MKVSVDENRGQLVVERLLKRYLENGFPYSKPEVVLPQDRVNLPSNLVLGGREHALFFFASCYWMRVTDSLASIRNLSRLYEQQPEIFLPEVAVMIDPDALEKLLRKAKLGALVNGIKYGWIKNARKLLYEYGGDPRNIFKDVTDREQVYKRMTGPHGFWGHHKKMAEMLTYWLVSEDLVPTFDHALPLDFQISRLFVQTECIKTEGLADPTKIPYTDEFIDPVLKYLVELADRLGISMIDLSNVLWLFGSNMCAGNPGNGTRLGEDHDRSTVLTAIPVSWSQRQLDSFDRTCRHCPIRDLCTKNCPAAAWNKWGVLWIRGDRPEPSSLF